MSAPVPRAANADWNVICGKYARSSVRGAELRFAFGHDGAFRGHAEGSSIAGFWIQPGRDAPVGGDPGGSSQAYATPVRLVRTAPFT